MGIFAVKDFLEGDVILHLDGPNIPIIDPYHMPDAKKHWALFESYWWVRTHKSKRCFDVVYFLLKNAFLLMYNSYIG